MIYVGSAVHFNRRWNCHKSKLRQNDHFNAYLQRSWNYHGEAVFSFAVLERCDRGDLRSLEQVWIDKLRPRYNQSKTATSPAGTPEIAKKISDAAIRNGQKYDVNGTLLGIPDIERLYGVAKTTFYERVKRGWTTSKAATTPPKKLHGAQSSKVHEYNGKMYSLAGLLPFASCSKVALFRRIKAGMAVKAAVEQTMEEANHLRAVKLWETRRGKS